ncbi:CR2 protein, partial [Psilopogon haemacephalus]|nr:CR2 protein [Psilopogon haemacephalus]
WLSLLSPAAHCPFPHIRYGRRVPVSRYSYRAGDTVSFACNTGFTLRGSRTSRCQPDLTWSPPLPLCNRGKCPGHSRGGKPL